MKKLKENFKNMMRCNEYYKHDEIEHAWVLACQFYNKEYKPILLKSGNLKLRKNVLIWDMPEIVTCKNNKACPGCYALKASRIYKNTRVMRAYHMAIIMQALHDTKKLEYFKNYIQLELNKHAMLYNMPVVRLHSAGDFYTEKYLQLWLDIINKNKKIKFYSYSKILNNSTIDYINDTHDNFNIVKSIIKINNNNYINYGNNEYLQHVTTQLDEHGMAYYTCDYGTSNASTCMGSCKKCLNCPCVLFHKH